MARKKGYSYNKDKEIVGKVKQNINKINDKIKELKLSKERNIRRDFSKVVFSQLNKKQKQILTDMKNLRQQTKKHSEDETLSQAATVSLLNLIGIIDVKIRLYKEDWKEWGKRKRVKNRSI